MKRTGAHGVVTGVLETSGCVDREATQLLLEATAPLPLTFHRAFDLTPELENSLSLLRSLGVQRILTSGGASTALVGAGAIDRLRRQAGPGTTLIAGGGVRAGHVVELVEASGVTEVHARPTKRRSRTSFPTRDIVFGATIPVPERSELDPEGVAALARELRSLG
jgi:copper homeostasis protein